jgi:hypothetical protein
MRQLERVRDTWPILPGSERPPDGWPGWPEGKKFAFVLTHDVEGKQGVENCRKLALLEQNLGFRSSFNFVPEGSYSVSSALRFWLTDRGFEVGVHDLHHDGQLYSSWKEFSQKAKRINKVLKEWGAVGFRSGYMLRNLEWIKQLDIAYDASTFDTDPFEPQPDGVNTIFPFWVPWRPEVVSRSSEIGGQWLEANSFDSSRDRVVAERDSQRQLSTLNHPRGGYVELPYTLPQDSTLFLVLREPNIRIWQKKLSWIADRGGMALVNVHPDFVAFGERSHEFTSYPASLYADFLSWVKQNYASDYWHTVPAALTDFVRPLLVPQENSRRDFSVGKCRQIHSAG